MMLNTALDDTINHLAHRQIGAEEQIIPTQEHIGGEWLTRDDQKTIRFSNGSQRGKKLRRRKVLPLFTISSGKMDFSRLPGCIF